MVTYEGGKTEGENRKLAILCWVSLGSRQLSLVTSHQSAAIDNGSHSLNPKSEI